jgi:hypothetical protein
MLFDPLPIIIFRLVLFLPGIAITGMQKKCHQSSQKDYMNYTVTHYHLSSMDAWKQEFSHTSLHISTGTKSQRGGGVPNPPLILLYTRPKIIRGIFLLGWNLF